MWLKEIIIALAVFQFYVTKAIALLSLMRLLYRLAKLGYSIIKSCHNAKAKSKIVSLPYIIAAQKP